VSRSTPERVCYVARCALLPQGFTSDVGYSQHAGMVVVADGTDAAARRLRRVLTNDPASGVMRHADAGYKLAIECAREHGLKLPMLGVP